MMGLQNFRTMEQVPLFNIRCRYNYGYKNIKEISVAEAHKNLVTVIVNRSCLLCLCCASSSFFSIMSSKKTVNKCSVPGCMDQTSKRHRFPLKDPALMQNWLDNIANPVLDNLLAEQVYASYYVCDNHFNDNVKVPGTKRGLKADAVPTLYLPESGVVKASSEPSLVESTTVDISEPVAPLPGPSRYPKLGAFTCLEMEPPQKKQKIGDEGFTNVPDVELEQEILVHRRMSTPPRRTKGTAIVYPVKLKRSILKKVNATRQAQLTPRCKVFYKEIIDWSRKNSSMQRRVTSFQKRLHNAEEVLKSAPFEYFQKFVNKNTYNFIMQQIRTQTQKPKSRRFTLEEKIMSLTFLKAGGRGYRLLSKIFCLPSTRTLRNLSNRLHLKAGINEHLFKSLEESCSKMKDAREKYCCLIFDEISISPSLTYRSKNDDIVGLEDDGSTQKQFMADHANVFMLKGIFKQWKQPLIYTFSSGPIKSMALKQLLQLAIRKCHSINLKVVATICDQGTNNVKTIKDLMTETDEEHKQEEMRHEMIKVDGAEVIPLYDVPHLFKGLRNNLLVKDLHFKMNGEKMVAKWDHIKQFYFLDMSDNVRLCPKLTDRHVLSSKINKMKVSSCTQVFSHQVGALMLRISSWAINDRLGLDEKAADTACLLLFLDKLFDSLNGNSKNAPSSKPLKGGVKIDSPHRDFWLEARNILNSMKFYCPKKKQFVSNPSIKNLKFTILGFLNLLQKLIENDTFMYYLPRAFNQDPLENFFGAIRSHGVRNTSPDVYHFVSSFKSLILNNFMSSHSPGANCEEDFSDGALDNLRYFLTREEIAGIAPLKDIDIANIDIPDFINTSKKTRVHENTLYYISSYIASKFKKMFIERCETCKSNLTANLGNNVSYSEFVSVRQYENCNLIRAGGFLNFAIGQSASYLFYLIPRLCHKKDISKMLSQILATKINFNVLNCKSHNNLGTDVRNLIIKCILYFWCRSINNILKGKDTKFEYLYKANPNSPYLDPMKVMAYKKYIVQKKKNKNKM